MQDNNIDLTSIKSNEKGEFNQELPKQKENLLLNSSRKEFNERKFEVLSIIARDGEKSKYKLAEELKIPLNLAKSLLIRYKKLGLLKVIRREQHINPGTGKFLFGRPFHVYALTEKGWKKLDQLMINRLRGVPLNLKKYPPVPRTGELAGFVE